MKDAQLSVPVSLGIKDNVVAVDNSETEITDIKMKTQHNLETKGDKFSPHVSILEPAKLSGEFCFSLLQMLSEAFCCKKYLNKIVHTMPFPDAEVPSGVCHFWFRKLRTDRDFYDGYDFLSRAHSVLTSEDKTTEESVDTPKESSVPYKWIPGDSVLSGSDTLEELKDNFGVLDYKKYLDQSNGDVTLIVHSLFMGVGLAEQEVPKLFLQTMPPVNRFLDMNRLVKTDGEKPQLCEGLFYERGVESQRFKNTVGQEAVHSTLYEMISTKEYTNDLNDEESHLSLKETQLSHVLRPTSNERSDSNANKVDTDYKCCQPRVESLKSYYKILTVSFVGNFSSVESTDQNR